jgi:FkbM family methyltransferase
LIEKRGYWWPDCIRDKDVDFAFNMAVHADAILKFCRTKELIIQAGGCVGIYPIRQSRKFTRVFTFEPEENNYLCLQRNLIENCDTNVTAIYGALTDRDGPASLHLSNYSTHRLGQAGQPIMGYTIDKLFSYIDVSALQLDVEGGEYDVLMGAVKTIKRCHPAIQLEELSTDDGKARELLTSMGYKAYPKKFGKDRVYYYD